MFIFIKYWISKGSIALGSRSVYSKRFGEFSKGQLVACENNRSVTCPWTIYPLEACFDVLWMDDKVLLFFFLYFLTYAFLFSYDLFFRLVLTLLDPTRLKSFNISQLTHVHKSSEMVEKTNVFRQRNLG